MNIIRRQVTVDATIEGTDYKGAVHIVDNVIERIEIEFRKKGTTTEVVIEGEDQCRDLVQDLDRILKYIDQERSSSINPVDFDENE